MAEETSVLNFSLSVTSVLVSLLAQENLEKLIGHVYRKE